MEEKLGDYKNTIDSFDEAIRIDNDGYIRKWRNRLIDKIPDYKVKIPEIEYDKPEIILVEETNPQITVGDKNAYTYIVSKKVYNSVIKEGVKYGKKGLGTLGYLWGFIWDSNVNIMISKTLTVQKKKSFMIEPIPKELGDIDIWYRKELQKKYPNYKLIGWYRNFYSEKPNSSDIETHRTFYYQNPLSVMILCSTIDVDKTNLRLRLYRLKGENSDDLEYEEMEYNVF